MDEDMNPGDIVQGDVGDCYFLSAVAALLRKTDRVPRLFPDRKLNKNGVYMAQLTFKGILQEVIVDERFPFNPAKDKLLGCTSNRQVFEIYGMVLEKCWAKLWKSYDNIDGNMYPIQEDFPTRPCMRLQVLLLKTIFSTEKPRQLRRKSGSSSKS